MPSKEDYRPVAGVVSGILHSDGVRYSFEMRRTWMLLCLAGCSSGEPDASGEEWAKRTLGEGAPELKSASRGVFQAELGAPHAPRPFVVIELIPRVPGAEGEPWFHPLNATLPAGMAAGAADDVQGLVIVRKIINTESAGTIRIKRRTTQVWKNKPVWLITTAVLDEDGRWVATGSDMIEGHEDDVLRDFLQKLPQSAPPDEE